VGSIEIAGRVDYGAPARKHNEGSSENRLVSTTFKTFKLFKPFKTFGTIGTK
jgi:hypothetical protein